MGVLRQELDRKFDATDVDGNIYRVYVYVNIVGFSDLSGRRAERRGLMELKTGDGRHVNAIEKGRYEIVGHPMIPITSDDPNAL